MTGRLKKIFDYQRFSPDPRLTAMTEDTEQRCQCLSDEALQFVAAAGEPRIARSIEEIPDASGRKLQ